MVIRVFESISDLQHTNGLTTVQPIDHNHLQRMTQGQKLIAVSMIPRHARHSGLFAGALAIEALGRCTDHR